MRASGFGTYQAFTAAGPMTAYAISYFLLSLDIEDYRWFWVGGTIIQLVLLVFAIFFMPETLPLDKRKRFQWYSITFCLHCCC